MTEPLVIGIDAGGTKTSAWIAPLSQTSDPLPIGIGHAGPGNLHTAGFTEAMTQIDAAIVQAFAAADLSRQKVQSLCISAAGAGRPDEQRGLADWASSQDIADNIRITTDAEAVLAAANPPLQGIALICGTGSLAWGRNADGICQRSGGWGPLISDEGSAFAIAVAGLKSAVKAADGRGPQTRLLDRVMASLAITTPAEIIEKLYAPATTRDQIASLAKCVFECMAEGDEPASQIVELAASELAAMVMAVATRLGLSEDTFPLALAGGVITHQHEFRRMMLSRLQVQTSDVHLITDPVAGAVNLARKAAQESAPNQLE